MSWDETTAQATYTAPAVPPRTKFSSGIFLVAIFDPKVLLK